MILIYLTIYIIYIYYIRYLAYGPNARYGNRFDILLVDDIFNSYLFLITIYIYIYESINSENIYYIYYVSSV